MAKKRTKKTAIRKKYTVKNLVADLKKIGCTPSILDSVGREIVYYEWTQAQYQLGPDHPVTSHLQSLLEFMRGGCERKLISGELYRAADTPTAAINDAIKGAPNEFLTYELVRPADHIRKILDGAIEDRKRELKEYKAVEKGVRKEIKESPDNADLWNKLRLVLWLIGKYKDSSEAFKQAKKLGWNAEESDFVAI
ncbi:MAG: hypothetical protein ACFFAY_06095 [Promethearchaeota archaeon]